MPNHSLCAGCLSAAFALLVVVAEAAPPGQMLKRAVRGDLPVVADGQAIATIAAADELDVAPLAEELARFVKELTGVVVPVVSGALVVGEDRRTVTPEYRRRHLILVGNALSNRAILPIYCRWLDASDGCYPDDGGYELRTGVDPYGTGCQELILGASAPTGARAGLEALKLRMRSSLEGRNLTLPQLLEVHVNRGQKVRRMTGEK